MDFATGMLGERSEHQPDWAGADNEYSLTVLELAIVNALHNTSQGFGESGIGKGCIGG